MFKTSLQEHLLVSYLDYIFRVAEFVKVQEGLDVSIENGLFRGLTTSAMGETLKNNR